ncbi:MAG: 3-phosphoshikimate 1-carboxyvinyltransferase [Bacteroidota bacterium]
MKLQLSKQPHNTIKGTVQVTGSKSETNRLLLLKALYPNLALSNVSISDDGRVMEAGLQKTHGEVDIHHAGTAMRFLTAFFASQEGREVVLTGSARMKQRPIGVLVEALKSLGAEIDFLETDGCPPLRIKGKHLTRNSTSLPANVSSQYISALLLIAPSLPNGLTLELIGKITSVPYIKMTLSLLEQLGVATTFEGNIITVAHKSEVANLTLEVESDWSSASYFYSILALSASGSEITLRSYRSNSLQGDSVSQKIYEAFGVKTQFANQTMTLHKKDAELPQVFECDLANAPDIAQTLAVTCFGLGIGCHLTGLHTLPIKETDRLAAMKTELSKFGAEVKTDDKSLTLEPSNAIKENVIVDTYHDHRMAMAFGPLALRTSLYVNEADVVSKSYPEYWNDLKLLGFEIKEV